MLNEEQRIFIYRLSRACRIVESAFVISSARFGAFQVKIIMCPETAPKIVSACCILHSCLIRNKQGKYIPWGLAHLENVKRCDITVGDLRVS